MFSIFLKRSFLASFFLFYANLLSAAVGEFSHQDINIFSKLLHIKNKMHVIQDPNLFAFSQTLNIQEELSASIKVVKKNDEITRRFICKFPARAFWINKRFGNGENIKFTHCSQLNEYLKAVDAKSISLVYASENLVSPSSFMGHSFLKLNGYHNQEHSVSYFTQVDTINIPKLMYESIVEGKEGFFIVAPFQEVMEQYGAVEARNIYEYKLDLTEEEIELIVLHLWELKDLKIDYFFHKHNCATISLDILGVAKTRVTRPIDEWLSPIDIVKIVNEADLVTESTVTPSLDWQVKAFGQNIPIDIKYEINEAVESGNLLKLEHQSDFDNIARLYADVVNKHFYQSGAINQSFWRNNQTVISTWDFNLDTAEIDVSKFKNPLNRLKDSQVAMSFHTNNSSPYTTFSWLPASHTINDDNRHAFSESSLSILATQLFLDRNRVKIDQLTLYGIEQYIPYDSVTNSLSGGFSIQYSGFDAISYKTENVFSVLGHIGVSSKFHASLQLYSTIGAKIASDIKTIWAEPMFQIGSFIYLKGGNKLIMYAQAEYNYQNTSDFRYLFDVKNNYSLSSQASLIFGWRHIVAGNLSNVDEFSLGFTYYY